jgi:hypothetical protein
LAFTSKPTVELIPDRPRWQRRDGGCSFADCWRCSYQADAAARATILKGDLPARQYIQQNNAVLAVLAPNFRKRADEKFVFGKPSNLLTHHHLLVRIK